jgi:hypothetical protein
MIDDITYLIQNSEKDSQVVYIDSSSRNKLFYPNSNEYTIEFNQPFKLVYGFEILDAAIPVTMYNIDIYNNTFYYTVIISNQASLTPIDPDVFFNEIITCKTFVNLFNNVAEQTFIIIGSSTQLLSYITSIVTPSDFYIMYIRSTFTTSEIVLKSKQIPEEFYFFTFNNTEYCIKYNSVNQFIIDIIIKEEYSLIFNTDTTIDIVYFTLYNIDETTFNAIKSANSLIIVINNLIGTLTIGNYNILTIINALNNIVNPLMDVSSTTSNPSQEAKMFFSSLNQIFLNGNKGFLQNSLGFDTSPILSIYNKINYKGWTIGDNYLIFGGLYDSSLPGYKIISPGLISLLGERFSILRIDEIEDHLYGSYSYMAMTPGIGLFKMASPFGGITNLRFDYTTLIVKPFHPIGKLSKLSIRWETSQQGKLYDFKGVNHQLLACIKFYVPSPKIKYVRSILNPNYEPDVMKYMAKNRTIENKEDSDDEEEFDDDKYYQTYKKELDKYDYSSSENNEDDKSNDDSEQGIESYMKRQNLLDN